MDKFEPDAPITVGRVTEIFRHVTSSLRVVRLAGMHDSTLFAITIRTTVPTPKFITFFGSASLLLFGLSGRRKKAASFSTCLSVGFCVPCSQVMTWADFTWSRCATRSGV